VKFVVRLVAFTLCRPPMSFDDFAASPSRPAPISRQPAAVSSTSSGSFANSRPNSNGQWDALQQRVNMALQQLSSAVPQIQRLIAKVGTAEDTAEHRHAIRERIVATQSFVQQLSDALTQMAPLVDVAESPDEVNKRRRSLEKLKKDAGVWAQRYVEMSKMWVDKDRRTQVQPSTGRQTQAALDEAYPSSSERQALLADQKQQYFFVESDLKVNEVIIREREEEIKKIEQAVVEVNDMFRDLSVLVVAGGQMIDSIEAHIEEAVVQSEMGVKELQTAESYQKAGNRKTCIIIMIIVCVVIVIVVLAALGIGIGISL